MLIIEKLNEMESKRIVQFRKFLVSDEQRKKIGIEFEYCKNGGLLNFIIQYKILFKDNLEFKVRFVRTYIK